MELTKQILDNFVAAYLQTAEWVEMDKPSKGFTKKAISIAKADCEQFINLVMLNFTDEQINAILTYQGNDVTTLSGHDFYLTRNRHGAGFWDKDIYNEIAEYGCETLTKLAEQMGESQAYYQRGYLHF